MSEAVHVEYGASQATIQEQQKLVVHDCPDDVGQELRAAGLVRKEDGRFVKRRPRVRIDTNQDDDSLDVLSARVSDSTVRVTAEDVVGMVQLLPGLSVHVEPKVGWEAAFEMLLTVYDVDRTQSFYGIPLDELTTGDTASSRILGILAINYVAGMRTVRRNGVIRELHIERRQGFEGYGSVDVERTLVDQAGPTQAPTWIETEVDHSNTVNEALLLAGRFLLRMLSREGGHPRMESLLAMVNREVQQLESLGVEASPRDIGRYRSLRVEALPRQRHYYQRALHASRSILSSVLLGAAGGDAKELLVDYALSMNGLFEDYSQRLLEELLEEIKSDVDRLGNLEGVRCRREPALRPFAGNPQAHHKPDHLLEGPQGPITVLDSKYYEEGSNPASESGARSRMFAYAYLTGSDRMAFLCPQLEPVEMPVQQTDGIVEVVSLSSEESFTCERYREKLREYVFGVLAERWPELQVFDALNADRILALEGADEGDLRRVTHLDGPFGINNERTFADQVVDGVTFSPGGPNRGELPNKGRWTRKLIREELTAEDETGNRRYPKNRTTCVPVYDPNGEGEFGSVRLYFLVDDGTTLSVETSDPISLR
ncbi:hypothetical protein [Halarchaeum sp. P4]|uniref:hypothetical protein n=1 Tax=Halarchaeum sp. P4 TaxID=3421639 RepID=UPI003EBF9516